MRVPSWTTLLFLFLHCATLLQAQDCTPTNTFPGPYICWPDITNISGTTANFSPITPSPTFCTGIVENNGWFSFSPCQSRVTFSVFATNCQEGKGLESVIYDESLNIVSNCLVTSATAVGGNIVADNLIPGELYYFMIDGLEGDNCDFVVSGGEGLAPTSNSEYLSQQGHIQGPTLICEGSQTTYTLTPPTCTPKNKLNLCPTPNLENYYDTTFHWTLPSGATLIGEDNTTSVTIDWNNFQPGNISVTMNITPINNSCINCIGGNFGTSTCTKTIAPLAIAERPVQYTQLPTVNLCEGECFQLTDQVFCEEGQYQVPLIDSDGCDSIVEFSIIINTDRVTILNDRFICPGECTIIAGQQFCAAGQQQILLNTAAGCDSTIIFEIFEKETFQNTLPKISFCEGDDFEINGIRYAESGNFQTTFTAQNGCDSIVFFQIETLNKSETILPRVGICEGDTYSLNNEIYDTPGIYEQFQTNAVGCDSVIILEIFEWENDFTRLESYSVCEGECVTVADRTFCEVGTHQIILENKNGCDSILEFKLKFLEKNIVELPKIVLCQDECFEVGGQDYCEGGQYAVNLQNRHGCDSLIQFEIERRVLEVNFPENEIIATDNLNIQFNPVLDGNSNNLRIEWQGFEINPDSLNPTTRSEGIYILTVTDTIVGCVATDTISVFKLNVPPSTAEILPGGDCSLAPFVCGESLNGFRSKTDTTDIASPILFQQILSDSLENPQWVQWYPCDSTVILKIGVLNSLNKKGIEFSVVRTDNCEQFEILVDSRKIQHRTVAQIQMDSLLDSGNYFFVFDGIDGDVSDFHLEIVRGIQTEPLSWEMTSPPVLNIPNTFCPDVPINLSVTKPKYALKNEHCSFFSTLDPIQNHLVTWRFPVQASDYENMPSDTIREIVFETENLLPLFGTDYLPDGQILTGDIYVEFEPKITFADGIFCRFENPEKFEKQQSFTIEHELNILRSIDICEENPRVFCGNLINESQEVICRDGCSTTVQFVEVNPPLQIDRGFIRLCPGECYTMPSTRKVICEEGEFTEQIFDKCGGSESVTIGFRDIPIELFFSPITEICDPLNEAYQISFDLNGGRPPYQVDGQYINGNRFISNAIPSGEPYVFRITDASVCANESFVSGSYLCGPVCITESGTMASDILFVCSNEVARTVHHGNSVLDSDDKQEFILHNNATDSLGQIFARSDDGNFTFLSSFLEYDSTYYVSSVVGNEEGQRVDLDDPCLSVSNGQPIVFRRNPNINFTDSTGLNIVSPSCHGVNDGQITFHHFSDGTPPYQTSINGSDFSDTKSYENLLGGIYNIMIRDAQNCFLKTDITIEEPPFLTVELGDDKFITLGDKVTLVATSNLIPYSIEWWNDSGEHLSKQNQWLVNPTSSSTYFVKIKDENGCSSEDRINIIVEESNIFIPTGFSPNDDEQNDFFTIFSSEGSVRQVLTLKIYNRAGNLVFQNNNFPPNEVSEGWDGHFRGKQMLADVYLYIAEVKFVNGKVKIYRGDLTLMR